VTVIVIVTATVTETAIMIVIVAVWFRASTASQVTEGAIIALWETAERSAWFARKAARPVLKDAPGDVTRTAFGSIVAAELTSNSDADKAFKKKINNHENWGSRIEDRRSRYRASGDPRSPILVAIFL
jgi:hypothetical protein